jgi:osmoprotectant transport system permease protein
VVAEASLMETLGDVFAWLAEGSHWEGRFGIPSRTLEHIRLSSVAVAIALVVALPVGVVLGHRGRGGLVAVNVANVARAVPSFALLVIALQVWGFGPTPTYVALVALAVPPILTNAYVGVSEVDADLRDAARGMGMSGSAVLWRVELPLAVPLVMGGVRTAAVQVVATATLAAFIGQGGLGRLIVDGRAAGDIPQLVAGAIAVAVLSIATELALGVAQRLLTPKGLARRGDADPAETFADAVAAR